MSSPSEIGLVLPSAEDGWRQAAAAWLDANPDSAIHVTTRDDDPALRDVDILITFALSAATLRAMPRLRWIQGLGAGMDRFAGLALPADMIVTNMRGIHGAAVAEAALALTFALARNLPDAFRAQAERRWRPGWPRLIEGSTLGILGVGAIAETLAAKASALGMTVEGVTRRAGPIAGFATLHPPERLGAVAGRFDYLVILAPLTEQTRGMVDAGVLTAMKPTAALINVGRGAVVDEAAMVAALEAGTIAAAGLDAFVDEPLPVGHPLWSMPNVIVTAHNAGRHRGYLNDALGLFRRNYELYRAGRTDAMINRIDPATL